jgi:uncharacterized protein YjbI with pentapeptide repeats
LEAINTTPFQFAPFAGRINYPGHSLTLIVKGTFDLRPDRQCAAAAEQLPPTGDLYYPDDEEMRGSCRYASDFALFKPRADLLLCGHCHVPGRSPVLATHVKFQVGGLAKTLYVFGDRHWKRAAGVRTPTDPQPFIRKELRYESSFGGKGYPRNPVGKGVSKQAGPDGKKVLPLPNIEDPRDLVRSAGSRPAPAGVGPLEKMWHDRFSKLGTYGRQWLKTRWPWFAEDFDYGYFNAAPPDMQVEGYLRGDEELYFRHLHPGHARYVSRLPGIRVRCFLDQRVQAQKAATRFCEVGMNLDTLWVDMDAETVVLVWRGAVAVQSEGVDEVDHAFILAEPLEQPPASLIRCHEHFIAALAEEEKKWAAAPEPPPQAAEPGRPPAPETEPPAPGPPESTPVEPPDLRRLVNAQTAALLAKVGIDMDALCPDTRQWAQAEQDRLLDRLLESDSQKQAAMDQADQRAKLADAFSKAGMDLDHLPPLSAAAKQEQVRLFAELGMDDPALLQHLESAEWFTMLGAVMPMLGIDPEHLDPFIAEAKKQHAKIRQQLGIEREPPPPETAPSLPLTRDLVARRAAAGDAFAGEDFRGIDLSSLDLAGIDFSRANFSGVDLKHADLGKAMLQNAVLTNADLTGANLAASRLVKADLAGADLSSAVLTDAVLDDAGLRRALLTDANAAGAAFAGADLAGAHLGRSNLAGCVFTAAVLDDANMAEAALGGADLANARLTNADLSDADLSRAGLAGANLAGACLQGADLAAAVLSAANLTRAVMANARLAYADLSDADLSGADLSHAILNDALLIRAVLHGAVLAQVQAVDANFCEADLRRADLSASDCSGADFSGSRLDDALFTDARLAAASVEGATGRQADFTRADISELRASEGCDLSAGRFYRANGFESIWHGAVLADADFTCAGLQGADFTRAGLQRADFSAAEMRFARLMKADLNAARLTYTNLFKGSLEKADLTGADLTGANLYAVEFLDAVVEHARLTEANLKMTKLDKG